MYSTSTIAVWKCAFCTLLVHSLIPFICIHVDTLPTWCMYACAAAPTLEDPIIQPNPSLQDTHQGNRNRGSHGSRPPNSQIGGHGD